MFGARFFNAGHFDSRYWSATGAVSVAITYHRYLWRGDRLRHLLLLTTQT